MNNKPKALQLANWCEQNSSGIYRKSAEAAAELRRLHAVEQQRDELLEACLRLIGGLSVMVSDPDNEGDIVFARAAISKHSGLLIN